MARVRPVDGRIRHAALGVLVMVPVWCCLLLLSRRCNARTACFLSRAPRVSLWTHAKLHSGLSRTSCCAESADWRDFRAKLVGMEKREGESGEEGEPGEPEVDSSSWAYESPLIEQGALLLGSPGDNFAINQQYFHKSMILIIEHTEQFTKGVILNRPTALSTIDLKKAPALPEALLNSSHKWNVWFGGDCQGIHTFEDLVPVEYFCLHTIEKFANSSQRIIRGVYLIPLDLAQQLVDSNEADTDDFLLLVGYCGWGPEQLQDELDRGDTWTMAAADKTLLLGRLRESQASLARHLDEVLRRKMLDGRSAAITAKDVGDGIQDWQRLYTALGVNLDENPDDDHTDEMLQRWISRCLIPARYVQQAAPKAEATELGSTNLAQMTILRGSATAWLLGKPVEESRFSLENFLPGQYLHRAVVLLLQEFNPDADLESTFLALLNGPQVGEVRGDDADNTGVFFGGPFQTGRTMQIGGQFYFQGMVQLGPGVLKLLLQHGALEVVEGVTFNDVLNVPSEERWEAAGGRIETVSEAATSKLGDVQRRKWYDKFLGLELPSEQ